MMLVMKIARYFTLLCQNVPLHRVAQPPKNLLQMVLWIGYALYILHLNILIFNSFDGHMDMDKWTWTHMDMDTWTWTHGHGHLDIDAWT